MVLPICVSFNLSFLFFLPGLTRGNGLAHLNIAKNVALERLSGHSKVGMDGLPVLKECVVRDAFFFTEKYGDFNSRLEVVLGVVAELTMFELVVDSDTGHGRRAEKSLASCVELDLWERQG